MALTSFSVSITTFRLLTTYEVNVAAAAASALYGKWELYPGEALVNAVDPA